jgi:hypothetical protein
LRDRSERKKWFVAALLFGPRVRFLNEECWTEVKLSQTYLRGLPLSE